MPVPPGAGALTPPAEGGAGPLIPRRKAAADAGEDLDGGRQPGDEAT